MPPRHLLRLIIVVFPIAVGAVLTGLGGFRFYEVTAPPPPAKLAPYGLVPFGSSSFHQMDIWMQNVYTKESFVDTDIVLHFTLPGLQGEQVYGFQIPHGIELQRVELNALGNGGSVRVDPTDYGVISARHNTSIAYVKFIDLPEIESYDLYVSFRWRDVVARWGFSSYEIVVPLGSNVHNEVYEQFPSVKPPGSTGQVYRLILEIHLPAGVRVTEAVPPSYVEAIHSPPSGEEFIPRRYLGWDKYVGIKPGPTRSLQSESIRVAFELPEESELRGRLLFDSGLFIGVGIQFIITGVHEAIKYRAEKRESH